MTASWEYNPHMTESPRAPFDELAFTILLGLQDGMKFARTRQALVGKNRPEKEAAEQAVAAAIAARLRAPPWKIERRDYLGPPPAVKLK